MGLFDDISGIWDDANQYLQPAMEFINPVARDLVPGFGAVEDVLGIGPGTPGWGSPPQLGGGGGLGGGGSSTPAHAAAGGAMGGWSGDWGATPPQAAPLDFGGGQPMSYDLSTLGGSPMAVGPRRLYPLSAGWPGPGYRVARRGNRRANPGYQAGIYWVPTRRMNPLNPRALLKAERRMSAFTHWFKRHFSIASTMPRRRKASARKGTFGRRKKR
jgi:hypothetical protein